MQVASHEENQQLAALSVAVVAAIVFSHFQMKYKLNMVSIHICVDLRLKGLSIKSHRTPKKNFRRRSYGRPNLEDTTRKSGAPNE